MTHFGIWCRVHMTMPTLSCVSWLKYCFLHVLLFCLRSTCARTRMPHGHTHIQANMGSMNAVSKCIYLNAHIRTPHFLPRHPKVDGKYWWNFALVTIGGGLRFWCTPFTPLPWFNTLITFKDGGKHARLQDHVPVQTVCWPSRFCMGWGQVALSKSFRNHCKTTQNGKFKRCPSLKKTKICAGPFWQTFLTFCISNIVQHNKYCTFNSVYTKRHNGWKNETLKLRFAKSLYSPNAQAQKLKDQITPHVKPPDC